MSLKFGVTSQYLYNFKAQTPIGVKWPSFNHAYQDYIFSYTFAVVTELTPLHLQLMLMINSKVSKLTRAVTAVVSA